VDCHFTNEGEAVSDTTSERNKAIVLEAFHALFNKRDYKAAEILVEHWDVIQDESTKEQSQSGSPMFGDAFPK
jgi:hypothetical protein